MGFRVILLMVPFHFLRDPFVSRVLRLLVLFLVSFIFHILLFLILPFFSRPFPFNHILIPPSLKRLKSRPSSPSQVLHPTAHATLLHLATFKQHKVHRRVVLADLAGRLAQHLPLPEVERRQSLL